jgi:hypothetical protein
MKKIIFVVYSLLLLSCQIVLAQSESYGTWTSIEVNKKINKLDIGVESEIRTIYYLRLLDRWSIGLKADYNLMKHLKVGVGYQFMNTLDKKYLNYQFRNRLNTSATGKIKIENFTFSLREKIQVTFKNDSKRITDDGIIDTYAMNPEWSWRNRLQIAYNIPHCKITPSFSTESFYQLNNPDGNQFDNLRYILTIGYKINKHNTIEIYGMKNSKLESEDAYGKYILGVNYVLSF